MDTVALHALLQRARRHAAPYRRRRRTNEPVGDRIRRGSERLQPRPGRKPSVQRARYHARVRVHDGLKTPPARARSIAAENRPHALRIAVRLADLDLTPLAVR